VVTASLKKKEWSARKENEAYETNQGRLLMGWRLQKSKKNSLSREDALTQVPKSERGDRGTPEQLKFPNKTTTILQRTRCNRRGRVRGDIKEGRTSDLKKCMDRGEGSSQSKEGSHETRSNRIWRTGGASHTNRKTKEKARR